MRKVLIDTSAYSHLLRGSTEILDLLGRADIVYLSVFVLGELFAGFKGGSKESANKELLERFLRRPTVRILSATRETAEVFAEIKHRLRRAGTPIPLNDVWIAAHAVETGSVLVTFDPHFRKIAGLRLWDIGQLQ
ncbi:MAG: type II toxin-antitoxin system VapC family toxin [Planctomycetes bacterium]|jgi:tRNA(fMet)-specific endonuclease VapC|nr:type II toxin-antitoxin system VapC family toxin [Planctomycetota bacterium]